jgi:peptidoglycan/LPS O-acetylase OafA/YrhL
MSAQNASRKPQRAAASLAIPVGLIMLVTWAVVTFAFSGPGWVHLLLTLGVFLVIWGIVARGTPSAAARPRR